MEWWLGVRLQQDVQATGILDDYRKDDWNIFDILNTEESYDE